MSTRFLIGVIILAGALNFAPVRAEDKIRVSSFQVPPMVMKKDTGTVTGLIPDLLRLAAARSNQSLDFSIVPWPRAIRGTEIGHYDVITPIIKTPEREKTLLFSTNPVFTLQFVFFSMKDGAFRYNGTDSSLHGARIVRLRNSVAGEELVELEKKGLITLQETSDLETQFRLLSAGRADLALNSRLNGLYVTQEMGLSDRIEPGDASYTSSPVYLATLRSGGVPGFFRELDTSLSVLRGSAEMNQVISKWFPTTP